MHVKRSGEKRTFQTPCLGRQFLRSVFFFAAVRARTQAHLRRGTLASQPTRSMTYVTHQSFASRMCGGLCGSLFGVAIYLLTFLLAGWNEGAYISGLEVLEHAYEVVDEHPCNAASLPQDGSLVFLEGCQLAGLPEWPAGEFQLSGPRTGAWFETAVEMYQWREVQHSETRKDAVGGGSTTVYWYSHERRWFSTAQPSPQNCDQSRPTDPCKPSTECHAGQGHCNPPLPASPLSGKQTAQTGAIRVGEAARLNSAQLGQLKSRRPLTPASEVLRGEPATLPLASLLPRNCRWDGAWATSAPPGQSKGGSLLGTFSDPLGVFSEPSPV